jgi:hypothetical protein
MMDVQAKHGQNLPEGGAMASEMVFVDDAVLGHLPPICAKTGDETWDHLVMTVPVGGHEGLGLAWLLLLLGPLGWLGLFVYAATRRSEALTVRLPYCDAAFNALVRARRARRNAGVATVLLLVGALIVAIRPTFTAHAAGAALAVIALGFLGICIAETLQVRRCTVRVQLDGSRRWVTLSRISEPLAAAVKRSRADRDRSLSDASGIT